jgi:type III pantothenate kinase
MKSEQHILVFDAGNSLVKVGVFSSEKLIEVQRFKESEFGNIPQLFSTYKNAIAVISSVRSHDSTKEIIQQCATSCIVIDHNTPVPITNSYQTPHTLGIDRLCNAVALAANCPNAVGVSIDIGTCLKVDCVNEQGVYLGGSIAPGMRLRYKALNDYTAKLPLLNETNSRSFIGTSTTESITAGVINGIAAEIQGMIAYYESRFQGLTFFVTGGDSHYFEIPAKNNIFADENLTLKGLFLIYKFNA